MHHTEQAAPQQVQRSVWSLGRYRNAMWALLMVALVVGGYAVWRHVPMTVQCVAVHGSFQFVPREQVRAVVAPYLDQALWRFPVASLRSRLMADLPWLSAVRVVRAWPPGIKLYIHERRAVAAWGTDHLLSAAGDIFKPAPPWPTRLPLFSGPADQASRMLVFYERAMQRDQAAQRIRSVRVTPRHAWELTLDDGVLVRLGRTHIEQRWRRFCQVYQLFAEQQHEPAELVFDFRYPNGFSIGSDQRKG